MDELIEFLKSDGYLVKPGTHIAFRLADQKQFIRLRSLGEGYSEEDIRAVIQNDKEHKPFVKRKYPKRQQRTTLLSELEAKINSGKGARYDQAMKVIKQQKPNMKIVIQTAFALEDHKQQATLDGADEFLTKPVASSTLLDTLDRLIEK